ncbi:phage tail protein [Minwuia thermotolerans]|uniref:Phage tail protein n=1 Tax=Minwuia thermotolerans TaxID=2056226 RepID=A0A2M9G2N7_9PROT|nr:phage tail protein [Minwuia thermotolerans]PJK29965.1 phage tail protein [Minwuia thermotolerans]
MSIADLDALGLPLPGLASEVSEEAAVVPAPFGDGYDQDVSEGVNNLRLAWRLVWPKLTTADRDALVGFLRARRGVEPFLWTQPGDAAPLKWTCRSWNPGKRLRNGRYDVTASFEQDFTL